MARLPVGQVMTDCAASARELETVPVEALFGAIRARCAATPAAAALTLADLTLDLGTGAASWRGTAAQLAGREAEVLAALMIAHPAGATAEELGWRVFRAEGDPTHGRVYVRYLRQKLPGLIPPLPRDTARATPYRLAVDPDARLVGDPPPADTPAAAPPRRRRPAAAAATMGDGPGATTGDEAFIWQQKFNRAYDRMWALETAVGRRLMAHNAGPGRESCACDECAWLRTLFSSNLAARQRAEAERTAIVTTDTHPERPSFEAIARQRLAEVEGERSAIDRQLGDLQERQRALVQEEAATRAAVAAYERALAAPAAVAPAPRKAPAVRARRGQFVALGAVTEAAIARGGMLRFTEAIVAARLHGFEKTSAWRALTKSGRFERLEAGVYRLRADAAA